MSLDQTTETVARWLARPRSRRKALGMFAGATAAFGLSTLGLADRASAASGTFTLVNQTGQTIWPGVAGNSIPNGGGWELAAGATSSFSVPPNWSGRIWARTYCNFDSSGSGSCETGDCGAGLACNGNAGQASATLAEFTLGGGTAADFYDVSLVDAFNLPMTITAQGGSACATAGCSTNLLTDCPSSLQDVDSSGNVVACLSACSKFGGDEACCTGAANSPSTCNPAAAPVDSASYFKSGCPDAYSYAYDTVTAAFSCSGASGYVITFMPFAGSSAAPGPDSPSPAPDPAPSSSAADPAPSPSPSPSPSPTTQAPAPPTGRWGGSWPGQGQGWGNW
jgi:hypothetical protein